MYSVAVCPWRKMRLWPVCLRKAIDSLLAGTYNCVIGQIGERIVATPYTEAERLHFPLDENMYRLVLELGR